MKILIVDDDEIARLSLCNVLARTGCEIVQADDGEAAWEMLVQGLGPVLCCSDVLMPRLDGLGLLRRVREHPVLKELPFVLISSASDRRTVQSAAESRVEGYILKPFLAVQTRATVERVLRETGVTRAEGVAATRQRLRINHDSLAQMLERLSEEVATCEQALAGEPEVADASIRRVFSGAQVLGLWRCSRLMESVVREDADASHRQLAVREAAQLVAEQQRALARA